MPFYNRVRFTSTTGGTAAFTVGAALASFRTPAQAGVPDGGKINYTALSISGQWEVGRGTYHSAGPTISRDIILDNSRGTNSVIDFGVGGAPGVWLDYIAQDTEDIINVLDFGAKGDGVTDDTAAIQAAVTYSCQVDLDRGVVYFPPGKTYLVTAPITFNGNFGFSLQVRGGGNGSIIKGFVNGFIFDRSGVGTTNTFGVRVFEKLFIDNRTAGGGCIRVNASILPVIRECELHGDFTIHGDYMHVEDCRMVARANNVGVGVMVEAGLGTTTVTNCDITAFAEGVRAMNTGLIVMGCRIEVNGIGLNLGVDQNGADFILHNVMIAASSLEGNLQGIVCQHVGECTISGVTILGENAILGQSVYGIQFGFITTCTCIGVDAVLSFSTAAYSFYHDPATFVGINCQGSNSLGPIWQMPTASGFGNCTFIQCNQPDQAPFALTDAASITTDASLNSIFTVTLGGNRTLANPTNLHTGRTYIWEITQDGTGTRTLAYGTVFTFPGGAPALSVAAAAVDVITATYDGTKLRAQLSKAYA